MGPPTSKPAKRAASRGLPNCGAIRFAAPKEMEPLIAANRMDLWAVPLRILIMIFPLNISVPLGRFHFGLTL